MDNTLARISRLINRLDAGEIVTRRMQAMVVASFALLIVAGAMAIYLAGRSADADDRIAHTMTVRRQARSLLVELLNAETSERGYVITQDPAFLEPFHAAEGRIDATYSDLLALTVDNPVQQREIPQLRPKIDARMSELRDNIALVQKGQADVAVSVIRAKVGKALMDDIRGDLARVFGEETRLLSIRTIDAHFQRRWLIGVIAACLGMAMVLAVLTLRALLHSVARVQDEINMRLRTEERLRQSQKLETVGQLTGGVAHDFNNLLTIILGSLDTMKRRLTSSPAMPAESFQKLVDNGLEATRNAAKLTHKLLAFSRRQPLEPVRLDINRAVAEMSDLLKRTLGETVELEAVLAAGLWPTFADKNQLENAVLNLANNARDAMPDGGRITIETANTYLDDAYVEQFGDVSAGQYVMVSVADTGAGIPPDAMEHIFEPFFTTKEVGKGTGLGLAMVHGFVKQSGGHIRIYSEVGQGTTVKIYLPRLTESAELKAKPTVPQPAVDLDLKARNGETILIVEDSEGVRLFTQTALEELGYSVVTAADGPEALQVFGDTPRVDLLLTDVVLPKAMNGRAIADKLRAIRRDLPVLYMTGYTRNAIIHHGRLDPDVELISKPFTHLELARRVRKLLGR